MAGNQSSVIPVEDETLLTSIKYEWEVEFSRFFNFPSNSSSSSSNLKRLPEYRTRSKGTWMSSSSIASLQISFHPLYLEIILTVFLQENIVEEHFTCNLHFSWPQVSCDTQCPPRGSRAVFASYRDSTGQIQKFALRFASSCDAQSFMDVMKAQPSPLGILQQERLTDKREIEFLRTNILSEVSSESDFASAGGLYNSTEEKSSTENHCGTYSPQTTPALNYKCEQTTLPQPQESLLTHLENYCGDLPPSFTALLTNCSSESQQVQPTIHQEIDLKTQITKYMSDSSFQEMLCKVEEVINEIGGDLAL